MNMNKILYGIGLSIYAATSCMNTNKNDEHLYNTFVKKLRQNIPSIGNFRWKKEVPWWKNFVSTPTEEWEYPDNVFIHDFTGPSTRELISPCTIDGTKRDKLHRENIIALLGAAKISLDAQCTSNRRYPDKASCIEDFIKHDWFSRHMMECKVIEKDLHCYLKKRENKIYN